MENYSFRGKSLEVIKEDMATLHEGFYNYNLIQEYKGSEELVPIICPTHGEFKQSLYNHAKKCGCRKCAIQRNVDKYFEQHKQVFLDKFSEKYENKLIIVGEYVNNSTQIAYRCTSCNIDYHNIPNKLLAKNNKGCAYCYGNGKNKQHSAYFEKYKDLLVKDVGYLYVVRLYNEEENFIKIGITKEESCETRFKKIPYLKEILFLQENNMYNCFKMEQTVLKKYIDYKYKPKVWFGGATELLKLSSYSTIEPHIKLMMAESLNQI